VWLKLQSACFANPEFKPQYCPLSKKRVDEVMEKLDPRMLLGVEDNAAAMEDSAALPHMAKNSHHRLWQVCVSESIHMCVHTDVYMKLHSTIIHNSPRIN
jgi:hypothetical protein